MEIDNIECVSSSDGVEDEEIQSSVSSHNPSVMHHHPHAPHLHQYASSKPHSNIVPSGIAPTSVHELLECPVCTNSMYPPIHQVSASFCFFGSVPACLALIFPCFISSCGLGLEHELFPLAAFGMVCVSDC